MREWYIVNTKSPYHKIKKVKGIANSLNIAWVELEDGKRKIIGRTAFPTIEKANAVRFERLVEKYKQLDAYNYDPKISKIKSKCKSALMEEYQFNLTHSKLSFRIKTEDDIRIAKEITMFMKSQDFTWSKSERVLRKSFDGTFPNTLVIKSQKTGRLVEFSQDQEYNMKHEFFDGEMAVYFPKNKDLDVRVHLVRW